MSPDAHFDTLAAEWDRRYASAPRVFRGDADESLIELVPPLAAGEALDLGAGEGRNSLWLARSGWRVTAVDASRVGLERLADAATAAGLQITTVVGDMRDHLTGWAAEGRAVDLVVLAYIHTGSEQRPELLAAAAEVVRPGGHLFVVGHHVSSLGKAGPPDPDRLYTEADLEHIPRLQVLQLGLRHGVSDVSDPGADVVLWGVRR